MVEYLTITWVTTKDGTYKCVICGFPLNDVFPDDYPDEFKLCCTCLITANTIVAHNIRPESALYFTERDLRIYNLIRLT